MNGSPREPHPIAEAMKWVGVLTTVALEMVLPGLLGHWLDRRFGWSFLSFAGFVLGLVIGLWSLLKITRQSNSGSDQKHGR